MKINSIAQSSFAVLSTLLAPLHSFATTVLSKKFLALAGVLSCALITQGAHALEPAVAFVGGNIMYNWQSSGVFGSGSIPIWLGEGFQVTDSPGICRETQQAQDEVNSLIQQYPNIIAVHLMVGADDVVGTDDANPPAFVFNQWQGCFTNLVNTVLNAHLKLVVGTIPFTLFNDPTPYNDFIFAYCASKGVPVINYYDLLRHANDNFEGTEYWIPGNAPPSITNKGYAIMNGLAATVLDQVLNGATLTKGYLAVDSLQMIGDPPFIPVSGLNTVAPNTKMHWTPWGQYSDGTTGPIQNANVDHVLGTWKSSNPLVVKIDPDGTAWALAPGTTNITFTTFEGVTLNEWIEYVQAYDPY
jgi:hypothetical protein